MEEKRQYVDDGDQEQRQQASYAHLIKDTADSNFHQIEEEKTSKLTKNESNLEEFYHFYMYETVWYDLSEVRSDQFLLLKILILFYEFLVFVVRDQIFIDEEIDSFLEFRNYHFILACTKRRWLVIYF